ncbi:MAG: ATP-binding protein [Archangium sp.]
MSSFWASVRSAIGSRPSAEKARFDTISRRMSNGIVVVDRAGVIDWVNAGWERITGFALKDVKGLTHESFTVVGGLVGRRRAEDDAARERINEALRLGNGCRETLLINTRTGEFVNVDLEIQPIHDDDGAVTGFVGALTDVSSREIALERLRVRASVLESLNARAPLKAVLECLTRSVNEAHPGLLPSVMFVENGKLKLAAAVGLTNTYLEAVDGIAIGPTVGSCGRAAFTGEPVITVDIETDPNWAPFRDLTGPEGLSACWSRPIKSRRGDVVAVLALYSRVPGAPNADENELIRESGELLAMALDQRETQQENALLRAAMESAAEAVVVATEEGRVIFHSGALKPLSSLREVVANTFGEFSAPLVQAIDARKPFDGRVRHPGSDLRWLSVRLRSATSDSGSGFLLTMSDATRIVETERLEQMVSEGERIKAEAGSRLSISSAIAERCAAAISSTFAFEGTTGGAIFLQQPDGTFARLVAAGEIDATKFVPQLAALASLTWPTVMTDAFTKRGHYLVPLHEGRGEAMGFLILNSSAQPVVELPRLEALTSIATLLTTAIVRDRAEQLLRESKAAAEEANRAKSDFLATMSHEIRTPMNGILGFAELLLEAPLPEDQRTQVRLIRNSAESLLTVINDVLDYSKIEAGKFVIEQRPMVLAASTREPLELLLDAAKRKGLKLDCTLAAQLPQGVMLDPLRYRQVLLNLVGNAIKFTSKGEVKVSVTRRGERFRVEVSDSGIGIPASVLPRLFGKFVQADSSTSRRFGGSGLGLAISRKLVELMGGAIGVSSVVDVGSTFWFELPCVEARVIDFAPRRTTQASSINGKRILVAEDNEVNQLLVRRILERLGCHMTLAKNGLEAIDFAKRDQFDFVLMDCQMPELDGIAATRRIREWEVAETRGRLKIIALTASAFADDVERCLEAGMDAVLTKPFKLADLEALLAPTAVAA